ncbi:bifunctional alpha,alpha-trehalose-phosphate synthase (UDP-forming)/trehalose-phosphatase [Chryseolinea lacunae]|uniref:Bifunctional alpha,alpha-trehalose-phosphate synthase (UDP-forming)/trehalose-phosphatase n=1 Tax=Chryseolinea lacunae TaxID=2801331 RepID=A0ABS1KQ56_9BACT|nr:bifunctional alpha,alpha-trehalose-phosphate synthase (UDP-forming)/trehalose-phosphatase [Chryseolinea lacunae]MBL0741566.1 bifunctional alpha,alpha-trehalose-phosphate synthase (UDP-forming)/trehalose-phosphatase [Chryseolinea lacunae]
MEKTTRRLVVVSNRLPFQLQEKNKKVSLKESDGGLVSALKSYFDKDNSDNAFTEKWWIGSADFPEKRWENYKGQKQPAQAFEVEPIFIDTKLYNRYYNGFCNATLWPLFHYFPSFVEFDDETFKSYEDVNQLFADKLLAFLKPGDVLWIHDYQLMLLPGLIRKALPDATIGFFLHIPFPNFEIFRLMHRAWKEKIINGLLGADLLGFHTQEYVQHFLKTVRMVAGLDHTYRSIFVDNRVVKAELFPLGIDYEKFHEAARKPEVLQQKDVIVKNFGERKIIFSVDRLDYTKGVTHRLSGFEQFLEKHPEWHEKVVFIMVVVPSRQIISKYNQRRKLIEEQVGRVNGKYSTLTWQPIIYRYNHLSFAELSALYQSADIGLITPLRDGMNLVAKEYVASQIDGRGTLILSELAGAASELGEAILVNPVDKAEVAQSIFSALTQPEETVMQNMNILQQRLKEYTVIHWVNDFLKQLEEVKDQQEIQQTKYVGKAARTSIAEAFKAADTRHLFLDYDGTLVPFARHPKEAVPDKSLLRLLARLSADDRTQVTIISGRAYPLLENWFHDLPINIVAEHGAAIRQPEGTWKNELTLDQSWKPLIRPTLELFAARSLGSFVEEKDHTLAWHYRNVDPELGFIRSRELVDTLYHLVRNAQLQVIDGNKVIEVRMAGVDKGVAARNLILEHPSNFILAIGDDKTDEDMFKALADKGITIKVGQGHTQAQFTVPSQKEVLGLLHQLVD